MRLAWVFFPNGTNYEQWKPSGEGAHWTSKTLDGLDATRSDVTLLTGLAQRNAYALGDGAGDHARSGATFLTGVHPRKSSDSRLHAGKSIDQAAAELIGGQTRLPSLELGIESSRTAGSCDSGYPCAYSSNISWKSPSQPVPKEINPRLAFERMFGAPDAQGRWQNQRIAMHRSVLDAVAEDAGELRKKLGKADRSKLDEFTQSLREVEKRLETPLGSMPDYIKGAVPTDKPASRLQHIRLMYDMLALAFRSDTTRVATFMLANAGSNVTYSEIGIKNGHHELSHHRDQSDKLEQIAKIDRMLVQEFARFLRTLREVSDGEGSLIDNCLVVYGSAICDGNRHSHDRLPVLLAGSGGGAVAPGRHLASSDGTPLNNLFLSMLDAAGAHPERFGDSTGRITGLST